MTIFNNTSKLLDFAAALDKYAPGRPEDSETLRKTARKLATKAAEDMLDQLQPFLDKLQLGIERVDRTINDIEKVKETLQAINQVVQVAASIVKIIPI
jgi:predicted ribosome quality control (RQC) complex YloA/Tae2 family protein